MKKHEYPLNFEALWNLKPKRAGGNPKPEALKAYLARIKQGYEYEDIKAGLIRYAAFCDATGKIGTEFTMQLATFFSAKKESWTEDWDIPISEKAETTEQKGRRLNMPAKIGESMTEWERRITQHREG